MIAGRTAGGKAYRKEKPFNNFRRIQMATKTKIIIILVTLFLIGIIIGAIFIYRGIMAKKYRELEPK